jgi:hypothetical protein
MALQSTFATYPLDLTGIAAMGAATQTTNFLIDASAEKVAFVIRVPKTGTLNSVGFLLGTVTQAPASGLKVSFQDVDTSTGNPDGTGDQFATVTSGLTSNSWVDVSSTGYMGAGGAGSGAKRSVTVGDRLAIVIEFASFAASDSLNIVAAATGTSVTMNYQCYVDHFTASWAKSAATNPIFSLKYDDGTYAVMPEVLPITGFGTLSYNQNTVAQDEAGLIFQVPFSCKVSGCWYDADIDGTADFVLYDSDGSTSLGSFSVDNNVRNSTGNGAGFGYFTGGEKTLTVNTSYRLIFKPTSTTNVILKYFDVNSAALLDQMPGGQTCHFTSRVDAGSWSQTTTRRPLMGLLISALDDGVSAGGSGGGIRLAGHGGLAG